MDGPQDLSLFVQFPTDIWAYLVCYLSGEQLGRFKMTGAKHLWFKLSCPRVVTSVSLGTDPILFKSWPAFLNELPSLESLSIKSPSDEWSYQFDLKLDQLPSTLRKLEIGGRFKSFNLFVDQQDQKLHPDQFLPHLEVLDLQNIIMEDPDLSWTMIKLPPSLTKLKVNHWDQCALPSSLRYFEALQVSLNEWSHLNLPSKLEVLMAHSLYKVNGFSMYSIIERLPPTLVELLVPHVTTSLWPYLPPGLQILTCIIHEPIFPKDGPGELHSYPFETLPRSIRFLNLHPLYFTCKVYVDPPPPTKSDSLSYYPPHLVGLFLPHGHLSPEAAKYLPPSLRHLELGKLCERVCAHLPEGLLTLTANRALMSPNLIKLLPKKLTWLYLIYATSSWYSYDTGTQPISKVEGYSTHKNFGTNIDWKEYSLPANLINLVLRDFAKIGESFFFNQNLKKLSSFVLDRSEEITDLSIPFLGPNLVHLNLTSAHQVTGECFALLPRALQLLALSSSSSINDVDIQHLPRTIKALDLNSAMYLTDACVATLPPDLDYLKMTKNKQITQESFQRFPCGIRSPQIDYGALFCDWQISYGKVLSVTESEDEMTIF